MTEKQKRLIEYLAEYQRQHGCSPTQQELADEMQIRQPTVAVMILRLEARGLIERSRARRSIRLRNAA